MFVAEAACMEKFQTEREIQEEQAERLRDTVLTELAGFLPLEAYAPEA